MSVLCFEEICLFSWRPAILLSSDVCLVLTMGLLTVGWLEGPRAQYQKDAKKKQISKQFLRRTHEAGQV